MRHKDLAVFKLELLCISGTTGLLWFMQNISKIFKTCPTKMFGFVPQLRFRIINISNHLVLRAIID